MRGEGGTHVELAKESSEDVHQFLVQRLDFVGEISLVVARLYRCELTRIISE